ncbi:uncharacterized protein LOC144861457 [Branchiostoma floridae x Branchiostoma japonicum]
MGAKRPDVLMILLVILTVWGSAEADCSSSCSSTSCQCNSRGLTIVPQDLPTSITTLELARNDITILSQSDFSRYRSLETLRLNDNPISTINSQAFYFLSSLTILSLSGNQITTVRADMFTGLGNLQYIYLSENEISDIQAGAFSPTSQLRYLSLLHNKLTSLRADLFTGIGNLEVLYLYNNEISDIQPGTFSSTPQLRSLSLGDNNLTNLRADFFTGLGNLQVLSLFGNEISDIQAGTFSSTPNLTTLRLHNNNITIFPFNELSSQPISVLRLDNNRLTTLSSAEYDILSSISHVNIENNPWQCDCSMLPFRLRMNGSHWFEDQINCAQPDQFHGQKLIEINPKHLICDTQTSTCITLPVLLCAIFGSIAGTLLIVAIVLTIWCKRNNNTSPPENPEHAVVLTNANTTAVITIDQKDQISPQGSLNPEHRPKSAAPLPHEYESVKPHPENPRPRSADPRLTSLNDAYRNTDERPPFPFPRSCTDGDDSAAQYQSLRKTDAESSDDYETPHDYVYITE